MGGIPGGGGNGGIIIPGIGISPGRNLFAAGSSKPRFIVSVNGTPCIPKISISTLSRPASALGTLEKHQITDTQDILRLLVDLNLVNAFQVNN